jgi:hypothetical protein
MTSHQRRMLPFVAAVVFGSAVSIAPQASAAEVAFDREFSNPSAGSGSAVLRHKPSQQVRVAELRDHRRNRYVSSLRNGVDCSAWCGRQFVLMIGIAY